MHSLCLVSWLNFEFPRAIGMQEMLFDASLHYAHLYLGTGYGEYMGCYKDDLSDRDLTGPKHKSADNSPRYCTDLCLASGEWADSGDGWLRLNEFGF